LSSGAFRLVEETEFLELQMTTPTNTLTKMYGNLDVTRDHPDVFGDPVFGVYRKKDLASPFRFHELDGFFNRYPVEPVAFRADGTQRFYDVPFNKNRGDTAEVVFKGELKLEQLDEMREAILNHTGGSTAPYDVKAVMNSETAFKEVSKKQFAECFIGAIQSPQAVPFLALLALSHAVKSTNDDETLGREQASLGAMFWAGYGDHPRRSEFLFSGKEFTVGNWAYKPLTADELRALPYVAGVFREVYDEVGQNHASHAKSLVAKVAAAGYPTAARVLAELNEIELPAKKPARQVDLDDGPSM
jgi:hypothetical protein